MFFFERQCPYIINNNHNGGAGGCRKSVSGLQTITITLRSRAAEIAEPCGNGHGQQAVWPQPIRVPAPGHLNHLEPDAGDIAHGVAAAAEPGDQHLKTMCSGPFRGASGTQQFARLHRKGPHRLEAWRSGSGGNSRAPWRCPERWQRCAEQKEHHFYSSHSVRIPCRVDKQALAVTRGPLTRLHKWGGRGAAGSWA